MSRRAFLRDGLLLAASAGTFASLPGCAGRLAGERAAGAGRSGEAVPFLVAADASDAPADAITLTAEKGHVEVARGTGYETWLYNGHFPGPEIRRREGDRFRATVQNRLPEGTTVHWHGVPVPNRMDGVPDVTQKPIAPGDAFVYEYTVPLPGSFLYHSHVGLQLDRGLIGPLIFEEKNPPVEYDRDYVVLLDDFLPGAPTPLDGGTMGGMGGMGGGRGMMGGGMRGGGMGMMGGQYPPYAGLLINGKLPEAAPTFRTKRGERVRFRFLNPSGATTYRVALSGHKLTVTHTDGRPVKPVTVDAFHISMGERYDAVVTMDNPGVWPLLAASVWQDVPPARAIIRYEDARGSSVHEGIPKGLTGGRVLELSDLVATDDFRRPPKEPDRAFDLVLSGGMMSSAWTINGQAYPDADPLEIHAGEWVRFSTVNHSMMIHPMHLHGHYFIVGEALKDTVVVPPHMGRVTFNFLADNPGRWFFHCHNLYHLYAGMARVVRYA